MGVPEDLILEIARLGNPVVVDLIDGCLVIMSKWIDRVDAVIMMFFAGEEGENALAEILSGEIHPETHNYRSSSDR